VALRHHGAVQFFLPAPIPTTRFALQHSLCTAIDLILLPAESRHPEYPFY